MSYSNAGSTYEQHNWQKHRKNQKFIIWWKTSHSPSVSSYFWFADIRRNNTITFTYYVFFSLSLLSLFFRLPSKLAVVRCLYEILFETLLLKNFYSLCAISFYDTFPMLVLFFINCTIFVVENWLMAVVSFIFFVSHIVRQTWESVFKTRSLQKIAYKLHLLELSVLFFFDVAISLMLLLFAPHSVCHTHINTFFFAELKIVLYKAYSSHFTTNCN